MTKSTIYGLINTNDIITNYYEDYNCNVIIVFRNGDDYEKVLLKNYNGIDFINIMVDIPNYRSEIDIIIKDKNIFSLDELKELCIKYRNKLPSRLIDYYDLDENLALTLFFEYLLEKLIKYNSTYVYINRL
jgi:hypothetical protein